MMMAKQIEGSFKVDGDALHVSILALRMFPKGVPSTMEHWARIAFLVSQLLSFPCICSETNSSDPHIEILLGLQA